MQKPLELLQKFFGHTNFRTPQAEIIDAVLNGNDAFALMPTGGGKSICFQIPGLLKPGLCLVISPLIALMKDQVENLKKKNIKAVALTGGLSIDDISTVLDNCQYGGIKFLYLSPERLQSDWIVERLKNLNLNLIAIDEAHCVSQWGHDFRPAFLKISNLKDTFSNVPFLALTATATPRVQEDVIENLGLQHPQIFKKSFARENLAYMIYDAEDKLFKVSRILQKYQQPSIIYVRNRKSASETVAHLQHLGITATFYHGGLQVKEKETNMQLWMEEKVQVMVATNAFGMGIDKPNVKTVFHIQLPDNLENYYQEAGRAGRNGEKAFAVCLQSPSDTKFTENQVLGNLPDEAFLKIIFKKMCSFLNIAYGEGIDERFSFNLNHFCTQYNFPVLKTYNALQFLDRQGVITLSQEFSQQIMLQFLLESKEIIRYISLNPQDDEIITVILRNYPGIYDTLTAINVSLIAKKSGKQESAVLVVLQKLHQRGIADYYAKNNDSSFIMNEIREDDLTINRISKHLKKQNQLKKTQLQAVLNYVNNRELCNSQKLLEYFGEKKPERCGICSVCVEQKTSTEEYFEIKKLILELLKTSPKSSRELQENSGFSSKQLIFALQQLLDEGKILVSSTNKYSLKKWKN
ncbi:RecQ family ATP-dependent DNA helicase [Flavobacterium sp. NST-5]|uniref:ATP-dependent DNA helicase RecQ n=1 Tax=Flavobacterium ichthyis TaxID=2698827 RepID=A0ABW9Z717_9FLAO|nr:ATP-dependent DNA helicase RecQ [Flavobacterium ichthyis]NBL64464.1 RecQ family ATP-dependent DNA helicase [Flavobacterium ichthyis]